jgi:hypothetical protein
MHRGPEITVQAGSETGRLDLPIKPQKPFSEWDSELGFSQGAHGWVGLI